MTADVLGALVLPYGTGEHCPKGHLACQGAQPSPWKRKGAVLLPALPRAPASVPRPSLLPPIHFAILLPHPHRRACCRRWPRRTRCTLASATSRCGGGGGGSDGGASGMELHCRCTARGSTLRAVWSGRNGSTVHLTRGRPLAFHFRRRWPCCTAAAARPTADLAVPLYRTRTSWRASGPRTPRSSTWSAAASRRRPRGDASRWAGDGAGAAGARAGVKPRQGQGASSWHGVYGFFFTSPCNLPPSTPRGEDEDGVGCGGVG